MFHKDAIYKLLKRGLRKEEIIEKLFKESSGVKLEDVIFSVEDALKDNQQYKQVQQLMRSKRIYDVTSDKGKFILYDPRNHVRFEMADARVKQLLEKPDSVLPPPYICQFTYDPNNYDIVFEDKFGNYFYNSYIPPFWYRKSFYSRGAEPVLKRNDIPEIYRKFLIHLVDSDMPSYNYILDWIANGIRSRNYCYLVTIGSQGIGKGVLGTILKHIFGEENYALSTIERLTGRFNSQVGNKRLIQIDEFSVKTRKEEDAVKMLVNDIVEVEKKGVDATNSRNHANFYFTSNNLDSIKLDEEDRRFSIINLTEEKLGTKFKQEDIPELFADKNIEQFVQYLYYREVDKQEMLKPFKSEKTEEVRSSSLLPWQYWFVNDFANDKAGMTLTVSEVVDLVADHWGTRGVITKGQLDSLRAKYPQVFKVKRAAKDQFGKRPYVIQFFGIAKETDGEINQGNQLHQ